MKEAAKFHKMTAENIRKFRATQSEAEKLERINKERVFRELDQGMEIYYAKHIVPKIKEAVEARQYHTFILLDMGYERIPAKVCLYLRSLGFQAASSSSFFNSSERATGITIRWEK
jgi:hypothetical protein